MSSLPLKGKIALIAGVADDRGFGWAIAKELAAQGATILIGTWPPALRLFLLAWEGGKFSESRLLPDGSLFEIAKVYPLDATFDKPEDVPEEIKANKRYKELGGYTLSEVADTVKKDFGKIDFLVHSIANGPEVKNPLLETSRQGYLSALSASSYSFVSLVRYFGPLMPPGSGCLTLSYLAAERTIPGYGGGMSSAKAALESDTRTLAFEAGSKWEIRVNAVSAGPVATRAASAIGCIDPIIRYYEANAPLRKPLRTEEVAYAARFLLSPEASAITGVTLHVDNGLHSMGMTADHRE